LSDEILPLYSCITVPLLKNTIPLLPNESGEVIFILITLLVVPSGWVKVPPVHVLLIFSVVPGDELLVLTSYMYDGIGQSADAIPLIAITPTKIADLLLNMIFLRFELPNAELSRPLERSGSGSA